MLAASRGGRTVLVTGGEDGTPRAWVSVDGHPFEPATMGGTAEQFLTIGAVTASAEGFLAAGSGITTFVPVVWRSGDGQVWDLVATTGLSEPADILDVESTPDGFVAAGALRTGADPSTGAFVPAVWTSSDGVAWTPASSPLPAEPDSGTIIDLVVASDGAVVAVTADRNGRTGMWRSTDAVNGWSPAPIDGADGPGQLTIGSLAVSGSTIVGSGTVGEEFQGAPAVIRSLDDGRTFSMRRLDNIAGGLEPFGSTGVAADSWWATGSRYIDTFSEPDACYRNLPSCQAGSKQVLLTSIDGQNWAEVDTIGLLNQYEDIAQILDTSTGMLVVGGGVDIVVWRPPTAGTPPTVAPHVEPAPLPTPLAEWGDTIDQGVTYRYPLYIHCGMDVLGEFNDRYWYLDAAAGPTPETGAGESPPESWPVAQQTIFGYLTLVTPRRIEYSIGDGEVIATYTPSTREPPGCA